MTIDQTAEKVNSGKTPLGGEAAYSSSGITFIRSQNVNNDRLDLNDVTFISSEINNSMKNSVVKANDILLNITGASLGRSCVVPNDFKIGNVNQHVCIIRLKSGYNPRFIQPFLSSAKGQNILLSYQTGSGREGLNFENIKRIKINFPKQKEQNKIANFLSAIDARIQTQSKIIQRLETLIKGIREAIYSPLRSSKWRKSKLERVATFYSGGTPLTSKKEYFNGKIPFIRSGEISSDTTEQFISELGLRNSSAKMVEVGDILFALYGATSGEVAISKLKGAINQAVLCIRSDINHYFIFSYLVHKKELIIKTYLQGGQGNLSAEIVKQIEVPIPTQKEQIQIVNMLLSVQNKIEVEKEIVQCYKTQKRCLLQALFI